MKQDEQRAINTKEIRTIRDETSKDKETSQKNELQLLMKSRARDKKKVELGTGSVDIQLTDCVANKGKGLQLKQKGISQISWFRGMVDHWMF